MKKMPANKYLIEVKEAITVFYNDHKKDFDYEDFKNAEDVAEYFSEVFHDEILTRVDGKYFLDYEEIDKAKEMLFAEPEIVLEALAAVNFTSDQIKKMIFLEQNWLEFDYCVRYWVMGIAVNELIAENKEEIEQFIKEANVKRS